MREDRAAAPPAGASRIPRPAASVDGPDGDLLAKTNCLFPPGGGGGGDCLERDESSSVGCQRDRDDDGSTFFDSLSRQWVRVNNFAFAQSDNHFSSRDSINREKCCLKMFDHVTII